MIIFQVKTIKLGLILRIRRHKFILRMFSFCSNTKGPISIFEISHKGSIRHSWWFRWNKLLHI